MSKTRQLESVIVLPATPEEVWQAITTKEGLELWHAPEARVDPRVGGEHFISWGGGMDGEGVIEVFEPGKHLRKATDRGMAIDIYLTSENGQTTLRLVNSGFLTSEDWDSEFEGTKHGWAIMLRILQYSMAKHPHTQGKQAWFYTKMPMPLEDAWARMESLLGEGSKFYVNPKTELAADWDAMGPGLAYADLSESKGKTAVSFIVVLYGAAISRLDEAAEYWKKELGA